MKHYIIVKFKNNYNYKKVLTIHLYIMIGKITMGNIQKIKLYLYVSISTEPLAHERQCTGRRLVWNSKTIYLCQSRLNLLILLIRLKKPLMQSTRNHLVLANLRFRCILHSTLKTAATQFFLSRAYGSGMMSGGVVAIMK